MISDELNHNCIINAMRLSRPLEKVVYPHLDMQALDTALESAAGRERLQTALSEALGAPEQEDIPWWAWKWVLTTTCRSLTGSGNWLPE